MKGYFLLIILVVLNFAGIKGENPVIIGNSRFTFINPGLVRLEYAQGGNFVDEPTLFAQNRSYDFKEIMIENREKNNYIIYTSLIRIEYFND